METAFYIWLVGWMLASLHAYYHLHREFIDGESALLSLGLGCPSWVYIVMVIYYEYKG